MTMSLWIGILAACGASTAPTQAVPAQVPTVLVKGRVVDAEGKGLAGVTVASNWSSIQGKPLAPGPDAVSTGPDGAFAHRFQIYSFPAVLTAIDSKRGIGGTLMLERAPDESPITIKAETLSRLLFAPRFDGPAPDSLSMYLYHPVNRARVAYVHVSGASVELLVPPGKHQIWVYSMDTNSATKDVEFSPGATVVVRDVELKLSGLARSYGKTPLPLTYSETRGLPPGFKLENMKGKWVLLEFWGFW